MQNQNIASMHCCKNCTAICDEEFKQVISLKNSGLLIYLNNSKIPTHKTKIECKRSIILYNSGHKDLKRFDYISELCQYKTKCFKCKTLLKYIRCLIDNISKINKNEVIGICEHCKRLPKNINCKRCEYLIYKFLNKKAKLDLLNEIRYNEMISTMRKVVLSLIQGKMICKHNINLDLELNIQQDQQESKNLPVTSRQPNIGHLFDFFDQHKMENNIFVDNEQILDIIRKLKPENVSDPSSEDEEATFESKSACVCKYLLDDKIKKSLLENNQVAEVEIQNRNDSLSPISFEPKKEISPGKLMAKLPQLINSPKAYPKLKQICHTTNDKRNAHQYNVDIKNKNSTKQKKEKEKRSELFSGPDNDLILNMKKKSKKIKSEMKKQSLHINSEERFKILNLPELETLKLEKEVESENSESVTECVHERSFHFDEMIEGNKIVQYHCHPTDEYRNTKKIPEIFHVKEDDLKLPELDKNKSLTDYSDVKESIIRKSKRISLPNGSGVTFYQLSNREFIDKGWTKLPTTKVMRKMNVYKMIPSNTKFDWFRNHKDTKIFFDHSSEKLAEIQENGCGKWFYKNGNLALDYYSTPELNSGKRCIVYSSDDDKDLKKKKSSNILACFDYLGNGIVYDNIGNVRIKFNQSEGLVIDKKIGPPGRWKWHTLNEPPVLYPVFFNTFAEETYREDLKNSVNINKGSDKMIHIELDKLRREKEAKLLQEYKSFQIRIKVVRINDYFTLRIISQAKIYVQFRCERMCLKINLGMLLKNAEILGTNIAEVSEVSTPYDYTETVKCV